jgi:hypothetical protein
MTSIFGLELPEPGEPEHRQPSPGGQIRCPLCGMIRDAAWFATETVARQTLERLHRRSLGGRRGFHLHRNLPLTASDVEALQAGLLAALSRLQGYAEAIGAEVLHEEPPDDPEDDRMNW